MNSNIFNFLKTFLSIKLNANAQLAENWFVSQEDAISPFYRWHSQTSSIYFAPYKVHNAGEEFYTSDYDLSDLSSRKIGLGLSYKPIYGLARIDIPMTKRLFIIDNVSFRSSFYQRSTGLYGI